MTSNNTERVLIGIAASPGICHGPAVLFSEGQIDIPFYSVSSEQVASETERLEMAIIATREEIIQIRKKVSATLGEGEALIFDAHLMVLEDNALISEVLQYLNERKHNIEHCFHQVVNRYINFFKNIEDEYLRERVSDIRDVERRVLNNLLGKKHADKEILHSKKIIVSDDISPSLAVGFNKDTLLGFLTDSGGATSHFVIMSRSLNIPSVVGLHDVTKQIKNNDYVLIDGYEGKVFINPCDETLSLYEERANKQQAIELRYQKELLEECVTRDGHTIQLMANIEGTNEIEAYKRSHADGIGLFRTEGLFLRHNGVPSEQCQYNEYSSVVENAEGKPVIIRTLDVGGDKLLDGITEESFLGLRAIRYCLENIGVFKTQLRAILRASALGDVQIMYPMISGVEELDKVNDVLSEVKSELDGSGTPYNRSIKVGAMIELPSAVMVIDLLASKVDFLSVGTNDLIQYLMAVDRMDDKVSHLYQPTHPAVLRSLKIIFDGGNQNNKSVSICGEMAGEPIYTALLLGLGAKSISVSISRLAEVKHFIRLMDLEQLEAVVQDCMTMERSGQIHTKLEEFIGSIS